MFAEGPIAFPAATDQPPSAESINWHEQFPHVPRVALPLLEAVELPLPAGGAGPQQPALGEWIVQLREPAVRRIKSLSHADALLDDGYNDFSIIGGLGSRGLLLIRGQGVSRTDIEASLASNTSVARFSLNQLIRAEETRPNDPDFASGSMPSLTTIDLPEAWDESIGSLATVVAVLDTGIDLDHPDLYLNVWFNQGEIPARFRDRLVDIDGDDLITFYDLNQATRAPAAPFELTVAGFLNSPNRPFVRDLNGNGYIDGLDILADPLWADGRDTDGNGEVDDFFGVNFRGDGARNNPSDGQGHGTHVSGTIGAVGGNHSGVTGVNWQTSLMSLRILDNTNRGDTGAAIRAIHYARQMRERYRVDDSGRVVEGANVRVLNNSWGQPGGFEAVLETALEESGQAGILVVAASGNGNLLGQGVDNDRTPFYPAGYEADNLIAVAASNFAGKLASFSNFGAASVDLAAPGVGVRSTELGGGYGTRNGTSMATPHVAGVAALIWSALPDASLEEVKSAILGSVTTGTALTGQLVTAGQLDAAAAIQADVFTPSGRVIASEQITMPGGTTTRFTVEYSHRSGIDRDSLGDDDLIVTRQWGPEQSLVASLLPGSIVPGQQSAQATYVVSAPGGSWDPLDFGQYVIHTVAGSVTSNSGQPIDSRQAGSFSVRIADPAVLYVDTFADTTGDRSLRDAIIAANAAGQPRTIILESGTYTIDIPHVADAAVAFPFPEPQFYCGGFEHQSGWSNEGSGDFDVTGSITIVGDRNDQTIIDARGLDRVFKVHPGAELRLERATISGGVSPADQGGGGILSAGALTLDLAIVRDNQAISQSDLDPIRGGGIAVWGGTTDIQRSWITANDSQFGGGVFYCGTAGGSISQSTLSENSGGGLHSHSDTDLIVSNSTFSGNSGGRGAIFNGKRDGYEGPSDSFESIAISRDGRFTAFVSSSPGLVADDTNGVADVFVFDRQTQRIERVSLASDGRQADGRSTGVSISADGRFVAFKSFSSNLVPTADPSFDAAFGGVFLYDRQTGTVERINVNSLIPAVFNFTSPSLSPDGRFVSITAIGSDLTPGGFGSSVLVVFDREDKSFELIPIGQAGLFSQTARASLSDGGRFIAFTSRGLSDPAPDFDQVFVYDRVTRATELVSVNPSGEPADGPSSQARVTADGRFVIFDSLASNLVAGDGNGISDVFVVDRQSGTIERVSVSSSGDEVSGGFFFGGSSSPSISDDGRWVTFVSPADLLVPDDTDSLPDVFLHDRQTKTTGQTNTRDDRSVVFNDRPVLSGDGRWISLHSVDQSGRSDTIVLDRQSGEQDAATFANAASTIFASQVTIAGTQDSTFSVTGKVHLTDALLGGDTLGTDESRVRRINVLESQTANSGLIGPLKRLGDLPPVHPLLRGNPAIDSGSPQFAGGVDQRDRTRVIPDIGALEATSASVSGSIYADLNGNQRRDANEPGLGGIGLQLIGLADPTGGQQTTSQLEAEGDAGAGQRGAYSFDDLEPMPFQIQLGSMPGWSFPVPPIERPYGVTQPKGPSFQPAVSVDGQIVVFISDGSNLAFGDTNRVPDIFVHDRLTNQLERVSVNSDGQETIGANGTAGISGDGNWVVFDSFAINLVPPQVGEEQRFHVYLRDHNSALTSRISIGRDGLPGNAASELLGTEVISHDGQVIAFASNASNLVDGDQNQLRNVFIFDRQSNTIERVSQAAGGVSSDGASGAYALSGNGRFVAFESDASNLVDDDNNGFRDVFVWDRQTGMIERVSVASDGSQANSSSSSPSISDDGRFVAFESVANNLVPPPPFSAVFTPDIYVHDRLTKTTQRISQGPNLGLEANGGSFRPSLSGDGRFVAFASDASNLVPGDQNRKSDIFVHDRQTQRISLVSVSAKGTAGNGESNNPSFSADGRFLVFESDASNLVANDTNGVTDVFRVANPLLEPGATISLLAGDRLTDLDFGLIPDPGMVSGRLFLDSLVSNAAFDAGEPVLAGRTVFLDADQNGSRDAGEVATVTDTEGRYRFDDVPSFRNVTIAVIAVSSQEQVAPPRSDSFAWNLFLPPGGNLTDRDFVFRSVTTTGQSAASSISGRVLIDTNTNGIVDDGDAPAAGLTAYLDRGRLGEKDFDDEPVEETGGDGSYAFEGLGSQITPVRLLLKDGFEQVLPLGNSLPLQTYPLDEIEKREGNPQAVATADFNADGFADVAVVLSETNTLSIRLNDKRGGFGTERRFDLDLNQLAGGGESFFAPAAIVVGAFDNEPGTDVAVTGNFTSNVLVLRNFSAQNGQFAGVQLIPVGEEPLDLVAGQFDSDGAADIVVVNKGDGSLQVLVNDGSGRFTANPAVSTGFPFPTSLVVGDFSGDGKDDVAVTHALSQGQVTVMAADRAGRLVSDGNSYAVQSLPLDSAVGDFNQDGRPDLAVANFSSKSISILLGQSDGRLRVQGTILGTTKGARDIGVADIDNDGDDDIIAAEFQSRSLAVFRNLGVDASTGQVFFEPQESIGVSEFQFGERMPLALAHLDNDRSGPGGTPTIDIVAIPQNTDTLYVRLNTLVQGSRRVAVSGAATNVARGVDFLIRPTRIPPRLDPIAGPITVVENSLAKAVPLTGIAKGRDDVDSLPLRFLVSTSNEQLIAAANVSHQDGLGTATLELTVTRDEHGTANITLRVVDAGFDKQFDTADDTSVERTFEFVVLASTSTGVSELVLNTSGETIDLTAIPGELLRPLRSVDARGTGNNTVKLDAAKIGQFVPSGELLLLADPGDVVSFDSGWTFSRVQTVAGLFERVFVNGNATVRVIGPLSWTNPLSAIDVNGKDGGTAADALMIVNELIRRRFVGEMDMLADPTTIDAASFRFYDTSGDQRLTARDALLVINEMGRAGLAGQEEPESAARAASRSFLSSTRPIERPYPPGSNERSIGPALSWDGQVTAFSSLADNLVSSDGNAFPDVFVVQQGSSEIDRVDRQGSVPDGPSQFVALSGDGNTLAFVSLASNLVEVDRNGAQDIFAYDRRTGDIELISRNTAGVQANAPSGFPSLSADGRYVAFDSFATNLVPDGDGLRNAFLFDRDTDSIERISNAIGGGNANGPSSRPVISGNGRFVLFGSAATNLVRDMPTVPGGDELFLHDRDTGATRHLDFRRDPAVSRHLLGSYAISSDGQVVAMELAAPLDLPLDLFNNELLEFDLPRTDIHVFEVVSQTLSRVSNGIGGADPNRSSFAPSLSAGGRYVAFHSAASNLDSGDLDAGDDIYLFDRQTSTTRLLSVNEQGTKGNGPSGGAVLSRNGQVIAFASLATNLVDDDNNLFTDVFVAATGIETQITLDGSNQTLDLSQPNVWLDGIEQIDIRGTGHNLLKLDAIKIKAQLEPDELIVVADPGDTIRFDAGWKFSGVSVVAGQFQRVFVNGDTTVRLIGPRSWTNPLLAADVNGENGVTALDALNIINELPRGRLVDDLGSLRDPTTIESALFNFFDPSGDGKMTAGDALFVINRIGRAPDETASEGSDTIAEVDATLAATADWLAATLPPA